MWRLRYKLSLRDVSEMFIERGFEFSYEAVRELEERFTPLLTEKLRARRKGKAGTSWYIDETYVKVKGTWVYLYRAIDRDGDLVDSRLSNTRDLEAAKEFFKRAVKIVGHKPERLTTDGHDSYPKAIRKVLGKKVMHRTNNYLNNRIEQDHRAIKQRYYPMQGFKSFESVSRFCSGFDELRNFFKSGPKLGSQVLIRLQHRARIEIYQSIMKAV
jgi:transposase-like protein